MNKVFFSIVSIFLVPALVASQAFALSPSVVSDGDINPARSASVRQTAAGMLLPDTIGHGKPLEDFLTGILPDKISFHGDAVSGERERKVRSALDMALGLAVDNKSRVPPHHQKMVRKTIWALIGLKNHLSEESHFYHAVIEQPNDYLLGFNYKRTVGLAVELVDTLSEERLAQLIFRLAIPQRQIALAAVSAGAASVYEELRTTVLYSIFGEKEVRGLDGGLSHFLETNGISMTISSAIRAIDEADERVKEAFEALELAAAVTNETFMRKFDEGTLSGDLQQELAKPIRLFETARSFYDPYVSMNVPDTMAIAMAERLVPEYVRLVNALESAKLAETRTMDRQAALYGEAAPGRVSSSGRKGPRQLSDEERKEPSRANAASARVEIGANLAVHAEEFRASLISVLEEARLVDRNVVLAIDTDIGASQKSSIMPLYRVVDQVREMRDDDGSIIFTNLIAIRDNGRDLASKINVLKEDGMADPGRIFIVAQKANVESGVFDAVRGGRLAWISAIDDSQEGSYLPVFEAVILAFMAYLDSDIEAVKALYDRIAASPIPPELLEEMIRNRVIYLLPKAAKFNSMELRELYEAARQAYLSA